MLTQRQDTRRRIDGSIDIDFYRQKGLTERRSVMTNLFGGAKKLVKPLVAATIVAGALYMAPTPDGVGWNGPNAGVAGTISASLANPPSIAR